MRYRFSTDGCLRIEVRMTLLAVPVGALSVARGRPIPVLLVASIGVFLVVSSIASTNMALVDIGRSTHASQTDLQWIVDAYTVVLAALLLPAGALGDRYGRRRTLATGLVVFGGASAVAAAARSADVIIGARIVMGIGAAMIFPTTLSIITAVFPPEQRSRGVAAWAGIAAGSATIGLLTAGIVLELFSWPAVFLLNVALAALCLVSVPFALERDQPERTTRLDPIGAVLAVLAIGEVVYAIIEGPSQGWMSAQSAGVLVGGVVAAGVFVGWELRRPDPMLDPRIFRSRSLSAGSLLTTGQFVGSFGFFFAAIEFLGSVRGASPLESGVELIPVGILIAALSPLAGALTRRFGLGAVGGAGLLLVAAGMLAFAQVGVHSSYFPTFFLACALVGAGVGLSTAPGTEAITRSLPSHQQGVASALNDTTRELGAAIGIAAVGSALNSGYRARIAASGVVNSLPVPARHAVRDSITGAQALDASRAPGGAAVLAHARDAFVHGNSLAMVVGAGVIASFALAVWCVAPNRPRG
jgi:EmrB/QacA subfamily drug resistance transporter